MPLQKISRGEMAQRRGSRGANPEYVSFFRSLQPGTGGKAIVADEGVSRQTVKKRLDAAAREAGATITYHSSSAAEVVFEVVDEGTERPRRGRPRKTATEPT
jgi:hypothetical protein